MAEGALSAAVRLNIEKWLHIDIRWGLCFNGFDVLGSLGQGSMFSMFSMFACSCLLAAVLTPDWRGRPY